MLGILTSALGPAAFAQSLPFMCGPDCSQPGRYVLCRDSFDTSGVSAGGIELTDFLEAACVSFEPPAVDFRVTGFAGLFGSGDTVATLAEVFIENGSNAPGTKLGEAGAAIPSSPAAGFSGLLFGSIDVTTPFRLCLRQQFDAGSGVRPVLFDDDGVQGMSWLFQAGAGGWQMSPGSGDFVLRAVVEHDDLTPWGPGGVCEQPGTDAGPGVDSGGPGDGGIPGDTGSPNDAGMLPADSGTTPGDDGGMTIEDSGVGPGAAPTITAISPNEGSNQGATDVTVTGTGFERGLTLMIGSIAANEVMVPGSTTILAEVPPGIAPGVYDVLVRNPDGQTAILPDGYTVRDPSGGGAPPDEGCGCGAIESRATPSGALLLFGLAFLRGHRRRA